MKENKLAILLLEDNPADAQLFLALLKEQNEFECRVKHIERLEKGLKALEEGSFAIILADLGLPDSDGLDTVRKIVAKAPNSPIVVLTGNIDVSLGVKALRCGAQDYLVKNDLSSALLIRSIQYSLERKNLEKLKDEFVGVVSHEMRTPLAIIKEGVSNIVDRLAGPLNEEQTEILKVTEQNIERLKRMIDNVLSFSRLEAGKTPMNCVRLNLESLLLEVTNNFQKLTSRGKIKLHCHAPSKLPPVFADSEMITKVLNNLIENAFRFAKSKVEVYAERKGDTLQVSIVNNGPAIDLEYHSKMFQKFYQITRPTGGGYKGTGLGLAICRKIIAMHHGNIWVESKPKEKVFFHFTLPIDQP